MGAVLSALKESCTECCFGRDKEEISQLQTDVRFMRQHLGDIQRELRLCC